MKIENIKVYDLKESIKASKYPMSIDTELCDSSITNTVLRLSQADGGHNNYLKGINVSFDLTFSNKAWVEMERYKFINIVSSQSTMHRITKLDIRKQCNKYVDERIIETVIDLRNKYEDNPTPENYLKILYNVPSGFELTARVTTNYMCLRNIYKQRKAHRLIEWEYLCKWIETLPHAEELILGGMK